MAVHTSTPLPPRRSRAALVASELEGEIQAQERQAGDRIGTKDELRERFGVAVATVNEAVRLLETRGVVEARPGPGGGIFVARPAVRMALMHTVVGFPSENTSYRDYLVVRDALEPRLCHDAALAATPEDIDALEEILERMDASLDEPLGYFAANWELHRRLARLTSNAALRSIYLTLVEYLEAMIEDAIISAFDGPASLAVHRELIAAIAAGPGPRLDAAIAAHAPLRPAGFD